MSRILVVTLMMLVPTAGMAEMSSKKHTKGHITVVPLTNMLVGGKKVWLPAEIRAPHGKVKFVLNNTLDAPHGFMIPGVMKEGVVVAAKAVKEYTVTFKQKKKYELDCHMHPAHVSAYIDVY